MTRTGWAARLSFVALSSVALFAQASSSSSDAGIFFNKDDGGTQRMSATMPQMHQKNAGMNVVKNMFSRGASAATLLFEVQGSASALRVGPNATFLLRLTQKQTTANDMPPMPTSAADAGEMKTFMSSMMDTPPAMAKKGDDFYIVHMKIEGGSRTIEATQTKNNGFKSDAAIPSKVDKTAADTYTLQSRSPLEAGEYSVVYFGPSGGGQFWTFGVDVK